MTIKTLAVVKELENSFGFGRKGGIFPEVDSDFISFRIWNIHETCQTVPVSSNLLANSTYFFICEFRGPIQNWKYAKQGLLTIVQEFYIL